MPARYLIIIIGLTAIGLLRVNQKQMELNLRHEVVVLHRQIHEDAVVMRMVNAQIARELSTETLDQRIELAGLQPFLRPVHSGVSPMNDRGFGAVARRDGGFGDVADQP